MRYKCGMCKKQIPENLINENRKYILVEYEKYDTTEYLCDNCSKKRTNNYFLDNSNEK